MTKFGILSYHLAVERKARLEAIEMYIGFGEALLEVDDNQGHTLIFTTTGLMFVRNKTNGVLITVYVPTKTKLVEVMMMSGRTCIPPQLFEAIRLNTGLLQKMGF